MAGGERESKAAARAAIFIQDACYAHQYIRSKDLSSIVERPERLRAVKLGLAAAISRLSLSDSDDLVAALDKLTIQAPQASLRPVRVVHSSASVDILTHPAVKFIHGDVDGDVYLEKLSSWMKVSQEKVDRGESEIPEGLPQGDLYLCPSSLNAIQGALGTTCEAVDQVVESNGRAFVAIRPPGHHCGEDTPMGFCFVNNVAVAAAHAHLKHGIDRAVVFDIDLHHGNGTQSIAWQINEETYRKTLESESNPAPPSSAGPQMFYGSIHDILSFPCEDGKPELVQAASTCIRGEHGQWIENIHLKEGSFEDLYEREYGKLFERAANFIEATGGVGHEALVFISCGMDASEHEYPSMSRHGRKVPTSFYHRFTRDAVAFADKYAKGRLVSVLEGGYSDRALISAGMAHLCGLVSDTHDVKEVWWAVDELIKLEGCAKKRRGNKNILPSAEPWVEKALEVYVELEPNAGALTPARRSGRQSDVPPSTRTLRSRENKTPVQSPSKKAAVTTDAGESSLSDLSSSDGEKKQSEAKKLPRIILKLGPRPETS